MLGKTLAHYQITAEVGKGGMGEVYRAQDTKLGRDVALKILPRELSGDPERAARFQREARSLAMLQHPNVASIYGFEKSDGVRFLVMELVDGEDLSHRIARGALSLEDTLHIARQIAEGLQAAHDKGIVHRDLKPANIMLTHEGDVKILDFGLARAWFGDGADSGDLETSPTITAAMTQAGTILGTAAYMSPEQARGRNVDQRADIWAFAVIVWEMLTGSKLFGGDTVSDTLAAVLRVEPELDELPESTPRRLRALLDRCLRKDRRQRLHSIADVGILLDEVDTADLPASGDDPPRQRPSTVVRVAPWIVAALAVAALGYVALRPAALSPELPPLRFSIELPAPIHAENAASIDLSPDGHILAVCTLDPKSNQSDLWIRELDDENFRRVEGDGSKRFMAFSPDSQWLLFNAQGRIKKMRVADGTIVELNAAGARTRAAWLADGTIIYTPNYASGLARTREDGGAVEVLTTPGEGELGHWYPEAIPGGRYLLYTSYTTPIDSARIMALDLKTLTPELVIRGGSDPRYSPTGHLLFLRHGQLMAVPFDAQRAVVTGPVALVLDDVVRGGVDGFTALDVADNGTLVWIRESEYAVSREVVKLRRDGSTEVLNIPRRRYSSPRLSPDGSRMAIPANEEPRDLWIYDFRRETMTRFTFGPTAEFQPEWTPDGKTIYYDVDSPQFVIHRRPTDGSAPGEVVHEEKVDTMPNCITPDGKELIFHRSDPETQEDLWVLPLDGGPPRLLMQTRFEEYGATISPDGQWMAYHSDESGRREIYVCAYPGLGSRMQVSNGGGDSVRWSPDGTELTYVSPEGFVAVSVQAPDGALEVGSPRVIYAPRIRGSWSAPSYDTYPDGSGWIFTRTPEGERLRSVHVETGWAQRVLEN